MFTFRGASSSLTLLRCEFAQVPLDIVLIDAALLNPKGMTELSQLHHSVPAARVLLVGDSLDLTDIVPGLRLGLRGMLARTQVTLDLERALSSVADGDLWLSRRQLAHLLMITGIGQQYDLFELTPRENAVMHRVLLGDSNKQVARALSIAEHTVKIHLHHIYGKLHVHRRVELVAALLSPHSNGALLSWQHDH